MAISLLPENPGTWPQYRYQDLMAMTREEREPLQLAALKLRFEKLKDRIPALTKLAAKQGIDRIESVSDAIPLFFDHRVLKSYPLSLIETRDFERLTSWLDRLTMLDLTKVDLSGLKTLDEWIDRLEEYGMIIGHSSGTTGKLSFVPRSKDEWPAWLANYMLVSSATADVDFYTTKIPTFFPGYRSGHQMLLKIMSLLEVQTTGGPQNFFPLYDGKMSSDLMSLAGRLQSAEDKGELDRLGLDPALLEARKQMIATGRRRDEDIENWLGKLVNDYKGQRVKILGPYSELLRLSLVGLSKGLKCSFAPDSIIMSGGGLKGYKDPPENWRDLIREFFGIEKFVAQYGFSEAVGNAPLCTEGFYHFLPYTIPVVLDKDAKELPREGTQTGRMAMFDLLSEVHWGGFISGDEVTIHWDENCGCGWKGPRISPEVRRYSENEGGDDKITCAGSAQAYNEFMDYVIGG